MKVEALVTSKAMTDDWEIQKVSQGIHIYRQKVKKTRIGLESGNFQSCFPVLKRSKMDEILIFIRPDKLIYIPGYAGSIKNANLRLFEPMVKLRSGQSVRLGAKSEI